MIMLGDIDLVLKRTHIVTPYYTLNHVLVCSKRLLPIKRDPLIFGLVLGRF